MITGNGRRTQRGQDSLQARAASQTPESIITANPGPGSPRITCFAVLALGTMPDRRHPPGPSPDPWGMAGVSDRRRKVADRDSTSRLHERSDHPCRFALMRVRACRSTTIKSPGACCAHARSIGRGPRLPGNWAVLPRLAPRASGRVVITGLTRSGPATRRVPEWPEEPRAQADTRRPLFEAAPARKLVVVIDSDLLAAPDDHVVTPTVLLTGLLSHPYIKLTRCA